MRNRLPIVLSATALVVAVFGITPLGHATSTIVQTHFAKNANFLRGKAPSVKAGKNKVPVANKAGKLDKSWGAVVRRRTWAGRCAGGERRQRGSRAGRSCRAAGRTRAAGSRRPVPERRSAAREDASRCVPERRPVGVVRLPRLLVRLPACCCPVVHLRAQRNGGPPAGCTGGTPGESAGQARASLPLRAVQQQPNHRRSASSVRSRGRCARATPLGICARDLPHRGRSHFYSGGTWAVTARSERARRVARRTGFPPRAARLREHAVCCRRLPREPPAGPLRLGRRPWWRPSAPAARSR